MPRSRAGKVLAALCALLAGWAFAVVPIQTVALLSLAVSLLALLVAVSVCVVVARIERRFGGRPERRRG